MSDSKKFFGRLDDGADPVQKELIRTFIAGGLPIEEIEPRLEQVISQLLPDAGLKFLQTLKRDAAAMLRDRRKMRSGFQKRLFEAWGKPLDQLLMLMEAARETGEECNHAFRSEAAASQDFKFDALVQLHARSCLVASEIYWLLLGGYASGAMARWRTLHEIAVVSSFIKEKDQEVAERYLFHYVVESCKAAHQYQEHHAMLDGEPFPAVELANMDAERDRLCDRFGKEYREDWGWASKALGLPRVTFTNIEASVSQAHFRPYFKLASHSNHAGSKGLNFDLGNSLNPPGQHTLLAGPSNAGLYSPGTCTAASVVKTTTNLLLYGNPTITALVVAKAILQLSLDIFESFARADAKITGKAKKLQRKTTK